MFARSFETLLIVAIVGGALALTGCSALTKPNEITIQGNTPAATTPPAAPAAPPPGMRLPNLPQHRVQGGN